MTVYGYIRVSTEGQNTERQLQKMAALRIALENLYVDKASGKNMDRPAWQALGNVVKRGDTIVIDALDRLGRNYDEVGEAWRTLTRQEGIDIKCLDLEFMDSAKWRDMGDVGKLMEDQILNLLAYVAQTEREKNRQRQKEGIAIAKAHGKYTGRKRIELDKDVAVDLAKDLLAGKITKRQARERIGVSMQTLDNMINDGRIPVEAVLTGDY